MAHSLSAKKRVRRTQRQTAVNVRRLSTVRTSIRKVELAIAAGNKAEAEVALRDAQPEMMRGVTRGVLHRNTVSRKISRLAKRIKALSA